MFKSKKCVSQKTIRQEWIPDLPYEMKNGKKVIAPCEVYVEKEAKNFETPELYVLFPYHLFHLSEGMLEIVHNTYEQRTQRFCYGWSQDLIQAALLGYTEYCARNLPENFRQKAEGYFFDAYFGPNYDWVPDQDHGCSSSLALHMMLLQEKRGRVLKRPAWPKEWKVSYRLPIPGGIVEEDDL